MQTAHALLRYSAAGKRDRRVNPLVSVEELPYWRITRSYYELGEHRHDTQYERLAKRLGVAPQTARTWVRSKWSLTMLALHDTDAIRDELATNRTYADIAAELLVDEISLRRWIRKDPDAMREIEEIRAEVMLENARTATAHATDIGEAKAASTLLSHAQWLAERLHRTKYKANAEPPPAVLSFNFDLGPASKPVGATYDQPAPAVRG